MEKSVRNGGGAIRWSRVILVGLLFGGAPYAFTFAPKRSEINDVAIVVAKSKALAEKMQPGDGAFLPINPNGVSDGVIPLSGAVILKQTEKADAVGVILGARAAREESLAGYQGEQRAAMEVMVGDHVPVLWNRDKMLAFAHDGEAQLNRLRAESRYTIGVALGIFFLAVLVLVATLGDIGKENETASATLSDAQLGFFKRILTGAVVALVVLLLGWSIMFVTSDRGPSALWTLIGYLPAFALLLYRRQSLGRDMPMAVKAA
jgi:hypothetical protein